MVVKQNSQYTFKYNKKLGRHGWLRLTPAYSVKMVEHILNDLDYTPQCLFEPFSGTGTTELVCANKGISSFAYDVNPFLVWLASTKTAFYTNVQILEFVEEYTHILSIVDGADEYAYPNIFHIERWWHKRQLSFLAKLKTCIWSVNDKVVADLLKVAFCREIIALSNAAFNHVSTSFGDSEDDSTFTFEDGKMSFASICEAIAESLKDQPVARTDVSLHNSMKIRFSHLTH